MSPAFKRVRVEKTGFERRNGMTNRTRRRWPLMLAFLLLEYFTIAPESKAASQDSTAVSKLLSASKLAAFQLSKDAVEMESLAEANVSWTSNADSIEQVR